MTMTLKFKITITTHFNKLSILETKDKLFKCYKMKINNDKNKKKIIYDYKIVPGISKHKLAIKFMKDKNLDKSIIRDAIKFYKKEFVKKPSK